MVDFTTLSLEQAHIAADAARNLLGFLEEIIQQEDGSGASRLCEIARFACTAAHNATTAVLHLNLLCSQAAEDEKDAVYQSDESDESGVGSSENDDDSNRNDDGSGAHLHGGDVELDGDGAAVDGVGMELHGDGAGHDGDGAAPSDDSDESNVNTDGFAWATARDYDIAHFLSEDAVQDVPSDDSADSDYVGNITSKSDE
jgi:hypothetical protein